MMKDTALVSFLGQAIESMELFRRAQLLGNADVRPTEALVTAAALYWALTAVFTFFQSRLERRMSKGYVRTRRRPQDPGADKVIVTGTGRGTRARRPATSWTLPTMRSASTGQRTPAGSLRLPSPIEEDPP